MGSLSEEQEIAYNELKEQLKISEKELLEKISYVSSIRNSLTKNAGEQLDYSDDGHKVLEVHSTITSCKGGSVLNASQKRENPENNMGVRGLVYLLNVKVGKMQQAYDRLSEQYKHKDVEVNSSLRENLKLLDEKEKWMLISLGDQANVNKLEDQLIDLQARLGRKEEETALLHKKIEKMRKELKEARKDFSSMALGHGRTMEEHGMFMSALKAAKRKERTVRENHQKQVADLEAAIAKIKGHKTKLVSSLKKHMKEYDVLKKQRHLKSA